ncbi:MAG: hypothetical protein AAGF97_07980 [Planctomycetota bacterium]
MVRIGKTWWLLAISSWLGGLNGTFAHGETPPDDERGFVRLLSEGDHPRALQTSIARYRGEIGGKAVVVDLVGAVHLGDQAYYERLNELFANYDAVLYEFVAPEGFEVPDPEQRSQNPLRLIQDSMRSILGLESQLEHVDYKQPNFVHADMSPEEMAQAMQARGDNMLSFALSAFSDLARQASLQADELDEDEMELLDPLTLLTDPHAGQKLKVQMARQFDRMGATDMALGAKISQLIVADRNQAALRAFDQQVARGDRRLAIFYGAAHMNDFETRLLKQYGFRYVGTEWLTAWDLQKPADAQAGITSLLLRAMQPAD